MFKKGDKIKCVDVAQNEMISVGTVYEVVSNDKNGWVLIVTDKGVICGNYPVELFKLDHRPFPVSQTPQHQATTLPTDSKARKEFPMLSGCVRYFPAALAGVAKISKLGNDKHNSGEEMHHARGKSMDHGDCVIRHLIDVQDLLAKLEREGNAQVVQDAVLLEVSQMAWRALALSQELHEKFGAPLAPGAKK